MRFAWRRVVFGGSALLALSHAGVARSEADSPVTLAAIAVTSPASVVAAPAGSGCGEGMIEVEGDYCPALPEQKCLRWASATTKGRCAEFAPSAPCAKPSIHKRFCMDRFEYPNREHEDPIVMKDWYEARDACGAIGKRLCTDAEWTLACEGPEHLPYPYGLSRDATACNIDKFPLNPKPELLRRHDTRDAEVKRLWQGEPSGSRDRCKSPYGVMDMTGNVDEWVVNETGKPHRSALKGGYWSWVRGRCRPTTDGHEEDFRYYQIGFRCCADTAPQATAAR
ncbi:MAG: SUMF1/EgtB/PvdO family nonheme iron enzyme [Labilithrix sp.]|nr:SUMF1/EgtB/PvdO family nonheme iron enzyme [Labilithrix sp.]